MSVTAEQARGILTAYQQVITASWPDLHREIATRAPHWPAANAEALERELQGYLRAASRPEISVRIFWKLLPGYIFGGCNEHFAHDAGLSSAELLGHDDFDRRLPWVYQAAKYRADDEAVVRSGHSRLNIVERQRSATGGITWVRVGKAPIRTADGVIGVLGAYEVLDSKTGRRLFDEKTRETKKT